MQQDNNLHKALKHLDDQQEPDLSNMEAHWQEMHQLLKPAAAPAGRSFYKTMISKIAFVAVVGLGLFYFISSKKGSEKNNAITVADTSLTVAKVAPAQDPITLPAAATITIRRFPLQLQEPAVSSQYFSELDSIVANMKLQFTPCETCGGEKVDSLAAETNNRIILQQFLDEVRSPSQEFMINNNSDTSLICANGTVINVAALSFTDATGSPVSGTVNIKVQEFYNYADIISSKLSTQSNGSQLVSGGMLHITAMQGDKELKMLPAKQLAVKMPANGNFDDEMQLFIDADYNSNPHSVQDTIGNNVNWLPAGQFQRLSRTKFMIKAFDPYGQPFKVYEKKDGSSVAKFMIARNCPMKNEDVLKGLKGHFGMFYNTIKVRRSWSNHPKPLFSKEAYPLVGDSIMMDFKVAKQLNLLSPAEIAEYEKLLLEDSLALVERRKQTAYYEFQLSQLGYMNCDRFKNDARPKVDYTFNFTEGPASKFYTVLAFDNYRSVVEGEYLGNQLRFRRVPVDEKVHLVSVGVKNGKVMTCVRPFVVDGSAPAAIEFTETTPAAFKSQLKELQLQ